jgi:ABC-2 type transport system permease protein
MNIFKMEVKKGSKPLAVWSIICILLTILFMSMFPSMKDSGMQEIMKAELGAMSPALLEAFNLKDIPDFSKLNEYFAYVFQYLVMAGYIYAGILGAKSLIKEESEGTIEFLYAQPASRIRIVTSKLLSALTLFFIFVFIMAAASTLISLAMKPETLKVAELLRDMNLFFSSFFFIGLVFMALGFLFSVLVPHLRLAMPVSIGVFFVTYILGILSSMIDSLKFLKYFSPFHFAVPAEIIRNGFKGTYIVLSVLIIAVCVSATYFVYGKKDFRI